LDDPRLSYSFTFPLAHGLHARPATQLAWVVGQLGAGLQLVNERTGACADCQSVLELVAAGVMHGDPCRIEALTDSDDAALPEVIRFIETELPHADDTADAVPVQSARAARVPQSLVAYITTSFSGTPLSGGVASGQLVSVAPAAAPAPANPGPTDPEIELKRFVAAVGSTAWELQQQIEAATSETARQVLAATFALMDDPKLITGIRDAIQAGASAPAAVISVLDSFSTRLAASDSAYLRERAADLRDIQRQWLERMGALGPTAFPVLTEPTVLACTALSASELLALDRANLAGLALGEVGATSHIAILARALGISAIAGIDIDRLPLEAGAPVILDGTRGLLLADDNAAVRAFYDRQQARAAARRACELSQAQEQARTADGIEIELAANVAALAECGPALELGAEGIGLLRTELLLAGCDRPPTEDEQFALYRAAVEALQGRRVIIRTLDVGGDKPLPWLPLPREENPFLGWRGARIYDAFPEIIDTQLRAICRASAHGPVQVMAPMIATVAESQAFRERIQATQQSLSEEGIEFDPALPIGIMLEVPAAALAVPQLAPYCDFFSLGTNDLAQYALAVDRGNARVAALCDWCEPGFLRLLKVAVDYARAAGRWIGMCGEMAGDVSLAPLLVGLGLDELSMTAARIPAIKAALAQLDSTECRALLARAIDCSTANEVRALLTAANSQSLPLLDESLIVLDSAADSKAAVLREASELLEDAGRVGFADDLEDALHAREATYSTGLGHGFAVPHCKAACVEAATLAVLRLRRAVDWGSLDGAPVDTVLALAMPEDGAAQHLRVFARLARKLMHDDFRAALRGASHSHEIMTLLSDELELTPEV
jgi:multiphosphoryl transfer protein